MPAFGKTIGRLTASCIRLGIRIVGRKVEKSGSPWLRCPMGPPEKIGEEFYAHLAKDEILSVARDDEAGLLQSMDVLRGDGFEPNALLPAVRDFYEHTAAYRLEAWSEAGLWTRFFLWGLTRFVSREMNQLNFPVSSLELSGGMDSQVLPMVRQGSGERVYTGWLRKMVSDGRVIYTGLYSIETPAEAKGPCVKVSFPLPYGSATVFLRPKVDPDGSLRLESSGKGFGGPGFYRMVEISRTHWKVRYMRTLREFFHVFVDPQGVLRTEHIVRFLGFTVLKLFYKMERKPRVG